MGSRHTPSDMCFCVDCQEAVLIRYRGQLNLDIGKSPCGNDSPHCNCPECLDFRSTCYAEEKMRSTHPKTIEISVVKGKGSLPPFIALFQRHFEKAIPACSLPSATVNAPIDLLSMIDLPTDLTENIESIELIYAR